MKYLVTGGLGFIGFHLVKSLLINGDQIIVWDNLSANYGASLGLERRKALESYGNILWEREDIATNYGYQEPYLKNIDGIFHLAALAGAPQSFNEPGEYFTSNVVGTNFMFSLAHILNVPIVYASSSSIYSGGHPYAATKRMTEEVARMWGDMGVSNEGFRFFTVYGQYGRPDMSLYKFVRGILVDKKIRVAKETSREYTHVSDVVWCLRQSMKRIRDQKTSSIEDISSGEMTPILSAALTIANILGITPEVELYDRQPWDPAVTRSKKPLGTHSSFLENIGPFVDWAADHVKRNL